MTISSPNRKAGPFAGNGITTTFPFTFKVFAKTDVAVATVDSLGNQALLTLDSDYSIALNADQNANPGGTITYPISGTPLAVGSALAAVGSLLELQPTDITNNGGFYPSVLEDAFDRAVILIQQLAEVQSRSVVAPVSDSGIDLTLPTAVQRANKALGFDSDGVPYAIDLTIGNVLAPVVHSLSMLRLVSKLFATDAFVLGETKAGDGGGGAYYLDVNDHTSTDNGRSIIIAADGGCWKLQGPSAGNAYAAIPVYPQTFGAYATRLEGGRGDMASLTKGAIGAYAHDNNPVFSSQLWTDYNETIGVNWIANQKVQTTVGPNSNAFTAGIFSEIMSYAVNNAEQIAIVGHARAQADRNPGGTGSAGDLWGGWFDANNQGHLAHCIGIEVNVTNQYANWMESTTPLQTDPTDFTFAVQVYPDWSTFHNTRGISIRPNSMVGFSTGILCTGFVDQGMFIDSGIYFRDPPNNTQLAAPIGILFGDNIATKMAVKKGADTPWKMNSEASFLLWRANETQWYYGMDSNDASIAFATGQFKLKQSGRMNIGNNGIDAGNATGPGLSIIGDFAHPLAMSRTTTGAVAPGVDVLSLRVVSGTTPGTLKLVAYAGTSTTATLIADDIGIGNSS